MYVQISWTILLHSIVVLPTPCLRWRPARFGLRLAALPEGSIAGEGLRHGARPALLVVISNVVISN